MTEAWQTRENPFWTSQRALGADHPIAIEIRWRCVQAIYRHHFFGKTGFRIELVEAISIHASILDRSARVLGDHHPLTVKIRASIKLCFAEQLDWTLDDFPADLREIADRYL